jgi:protein-disulfide isomerase
MKSQNSLLVPVIAAAIVAALVTGAGLYGFHKNQEAQLAAISPAQPAPEKESAGFSNAQKQSIETVVRDYLVKNPEILIEMSSELERKQAEAEQENRNSVIAENADEIFRDDHGLIGGNPDGDVTVVEFSDYNCPYCKRAFNAVAKLIESDPKVRVVMKEFPIFGDQSEGAAHVAIAAGLQGKYFEMHSALLQSSGRNNKESALKIAEGLGLDMEKLKADADSPEVDKIIEDTRELGEKLGVQGTPFYLVGDRVVPGAPDNLYEIFVETVGEVRKNGCTVAC